MNDTNLVQKPAPELQRRARAGSARLAVLILLACVSTSALGWSRGGHMVSAAIAYEELAAHDARTIDRLMDIMAAHPDRGAFEVAVGARRRDARALHVLMEMARWADDIRGGEYDQPTWHYAGRSLADAETPERANEHRSGAAFEAFALQVRIASDPRAPAHQRAIAWCWIFHLVGDIHQPLHAADLYGRAFPDGDRGGSRFFVLDPATNEPVSLHWFWDDAVRARDAESAIEKARELRNRYSRAHFGARLGAGEPADAFSTWARESYELAQSLAYREDVHRSASEQRARALPPAYAAASEQAAEQRLTLAGYRLADLVRRILR